MKKLKKLVIANLVCTLTLFIFVLVLFLTIVVNPDNFLTKNKLEASVDKYVSDEDKEENYVFLGDSITHYFNINDLYESNISFINSGENGNKVENLFDRLQESVYKYNPKKIFLLIGINDLNNEKNDINKVYEEIVDLVVTLENNTNAQIYLESIYPVNNSKEIDNNRTFNRNNKDVRLVNEKLEDYCENEGYVTYINVYNELIDEDGNLKMKYTTDGLHLNTLGYVKVTKVLSKYL